MVAVFVPLALLLGLAVGALGPFKNLAILGAIVIMILGYAYVGIVVLLRLGLGPKANALPNKPLQPTSGGRVEVE